MTARIRPTAIVEPGVQVGEGTAIWDNVHIRAPATIGRECIIGEKTYIAYGVEIGDLVKVNAHAYICTGVTLERGVMVSAGVVFTNDRFPRATTPDLRELRPSQPDDSTESTVVREGATIGAGAVIGPGVEIGRFAMVGMGSVVTRSIGDFRLALGNPARPAGVACRCGHVVEESETSPMECGNCGRHYQIADGRVSETG